MIDPLSSSLSGQKNKFLSTEIIKPSPLSSLFFFSNARLSQLRTSSNGIDLLISLKFKNSCFDKEQNPFCFYLSYHTNKKAGKRFVRCQSFTNISRNYSCKFVLRPNSHKVAMRIKVVALSVPNAT